jgi:hypothetical protein
LGCWVGGKHDRAADTLVEAFGSCDRDAFDGLAGDALEREVSPETFAEVCRGFQWLGPLRDKDSTMRSCGVSGTGENYELSFDEGSVDFELKMMGDEVIGFVVSSETWKRAVRAGQDARNAEFGIHEVQFLRPDGTDNPFAYRYDPGPIVLGLVVGGLELSDEGQYIVDVRHTSVSLRDGVEEEVPSERLTLDAKPAEAGRGPFKINRRFDATRPGRYRVDFVVTDAVSGKETSQSATVQVDG